jgi:hypothetical protein
MLNYNKYFYFLLILHLIIPMIFQILQQLHLINLIPYKFIQSFHVLYQIHFFIFNHTINLDYIILIA